MQVQFNPHYKQARTKYANYFDIKVALKLQKQTLSVKYCYNYLKHCDSSLSGYAYPAIATIARAIHRSPRQTIRILNKLIALGLIARVKASWDHTYYLLLIPFEIKALYSQCHTNIKYIPKGNRRSKVEPTTCSGITRISFPKSDNPLASDGVRAKAHPQDFDITWVLELIEKVQSEILERKLKFQRMNKVKNKQGFIF